MRKRRGMKAPPLNGKSTAQSAASPIRVHALLWALTGLFTLRVLGQALQKWLPLRLLPPFQAFQGSNIAYPELLTAQLLILAVMYRTAWRVQQGTRSPSRRAAKLLLWVGGIYMAGSLTRLAIGIGWSGAPSWFTAWISGVFHVILAGYLLALAVFYQRGSSNGVDHAP
jgi:hypothetical protein